MERDKRNLEHPLESLDSLEPDFRAQLSAKIGINSVESLFGYLLVEANHDQLKLNLSYSDAQMAELLSRCIAVIGAQRANEIRDTKPWLGPTGLIHGQPENDND